MFTFNVFFLSDKVILPRKRRDGTTTLLGKGTTFHGPLDSFPHEDVLKAALGRRDLEQHPCSLQCPRERCCMCDPDSANLRPGYKQRTVQATVSCEHRHWREEPVSVLQGGNWPDPFSSWSNRNAFNGKRGRNSLRQPGRLLLCEPECGLP